MKNILWIDWVLIILTFIMIFEIMIQFILSGYSHWMLVNAVIYFVTWFLRALISVEKVGQ